MKEFLITLLLICVWTVGCFPAQPAFHVLAGDRINQFSNSQTGFDPWISAIPNGICAHMICDRFVGEGGIEYQVDIGIIRVITMMLSVPESERNLFLWQAFWALFPDIWDKGFGTKIFHTSDSSYQPISSGMTNFAESFSVLIFVYKF